MMQSAGGTAPDAINTPFVGSGEVHNNSTGAYSGTCANCHTPTGTLQAAPTRAPSLSATGGNCSACHDDTGVNYFENHTHDHSYNSRYPDEHHRSEHLELPDVRLSYSDHESV